MYLTKTQGDAVRRIECINLRMSVFVAVMIAATLISSVANADGVTVLQEADGYSAISEIYGDSLSQMNGALSVNQAAGDSNAQNNSRAIAVTQDGGVAIAYIFDKQSVEMNGADIPDVAISRISDQAFSGVNGLIGISQASGVQNRQLNAFAMAISVSGAVSDLTLAETYADAPVVLPENPQAVTASRTARIENTTFIGAAGVVQINQTSGSGNVNLNRIEMSTGNAGN